MSWVGTPERPSWGLGAPQCNDYHVTVMSLLCPAQCAICMVMGTCMHTRPRLDSAFMELELLCCMGACSLVQTQYNLL